MAWTDLIDIVDEKDNVIGSLPIIEARQSGKIHRIARVMVEKDDSSMILLQRRLDDEDVYPGCWDNSAAGHVDSGESYEIAALRELHEEIGIKAESLEFMGKYYSEHKYEEDLIRRFTSCYRYKTDETPTNLQAEEVGEVRWFTLNEIRKLIELSPNKVTDGIHDVIKNFYP